ncbi:MAG: oxygenase MpaB family protein [Micrococcus sp.]|nr:oxygenase MpaB family protein [Micrococcus sp.]
MGDPHPADPRPPWTSWAAMRVLAPFRASLLYTFTKDRSGAVPAWQDELAHGNDAGHYGPDSAVWEVHGGMSTIPAGIRALLTQALHPGALAGVAEHSAYRSDPLARLAGTIRWIFTVTYGSTEQARAACDYVARRHQPVVGTYRTRDGEERPYSANDEHLARWVHIAFTDAFLRCYEDFTGPVPRTATSQPGETGADTYVREWALAAELMGIADPPRSVAELNAELERFLAGELTGGPRVDEVVRFLRRPPFERNLRAGYAALFVAVVDTLDPAHRALLGVRASPSPSVTRWLARRTLTVIGWLLPRPGPAEQRARQRRAQWSA